MVNNLTISVPHMSPKMSFSSCSTVLQEETNASDPFSTRNKIVAVKKRLMVIGTRELIQQTTTGDINQFPTSSIFTYMERESHHIFIKQEKVARLYIMYQINILQYICTNSAVAAEVVKERVHIFLLFISIRQTRQPTANLLKQNRFI